MTSLRKTAFVAGLLYLITYLAIPTIALYGPVLSDPGYIASSNDSTGVLWGAVLELIVAFAIVGTGVALFPVLRRQNEGVALGFVTSRLFEAGVITVGIISLLSIVTLQQDVGATAGADAGALAITGRSLIATHDWSFLIGQTLLPGINALLLGSLFYKSRLVPRVIPLMGLIGGPLLISSAIGQVVGVNEQYTAWSAIAVLPIFLWELALGLWLVFKGFRKDAPLMIEAAAADDVRDGGRPTAAGSSGGWRGVEGRRSMTAVREQTPRTPPRIVVRTAWLLHRAPVRLSGGASASPGRRRAAGSGCSGSRPSDDGRASPGSRSSATTRTARTSSPWP